MIRIWSEETTCFEDGVCRVSHVSLLYTRQLMQVRTILVTSSSSSAVYTARSPLSDFAWLLLLTSNSSSSTSSSSRVRVVV